MPCRSYGRIEPLMICHQPVRFTASPSHRSVPARIPASYRQARRKRIATAVNPPAPWLQ
jgi:hypothetical protein